MNLSRSAILTVLIVAGLAAGTVLVAGYVDKPDQPAQVAENSKCNGCPLKDTDACCQDKPAGCGDSAPACASQCPRPACPSQSAACCPQEAPKPPCAASDSAEQTVSPCGAGGCIQVE